MNKRDKSFLGFTIIELLVVMSIISLISSIIFAEFVTSKKKSRDVTRMSNLLEMQKAIEIYRTEYGSYPSTSDQYWAGAGTCSGATVTAKGYGNTGYIPGIAPAFIANLPEDPAPLTNRCYIYRSNGVDYMVTAFNGIEAFNPNTAPHPLDRSSTTDQSIAVYSSGASGW